MAVSVFRCLVSKYLVSGDCLQGSCSYISLVKVWWAGHVHEVVTRSGWDFSLGTIATCNVSVCVCERETGILCVACFTASPVSIRILSTFLIETSRVTVSTAQGKRYAVVYVCNHKRNPQAAFCRALLVEGRCAPHCGSWDYARHVVLRICTHDERCPKENCAFMVRIDCLLAT